MALRLHLIASALFWSISPFRCTFCRYAHMRPVMRTAVLRVSAYRPSFWAIHWLESIAYSYLTSFLLQLLPLLSIQC